MIAHKYISIIKKVNTIIKKEGVKFFIQKAVETLAYNLWIYRNEKIQYYLKYAKVATTRFHYRPKISIIMPVYRTPIIYLNEAIQSVRAQLYTNWELIIIDDCSETPDLHNFLKKTAKQDKRITYQNRTHRGNISVAANNGLDLSTGDYIAFLDHDDQISPDALFWIVEALNHNRQAKLLYSDEDKISSEGIRYSPHFKSDWNEELFYSHNYICHLLVIEKKIVSDVGGFRKGYEGAQDYDLILRIASKIDNKSITHIPRVLYHWRSIKGSTALNANEKSYAHICGQRALKDHFRANKITADISDGKIPTSYHVKYFFTEEPTVTLIIPTRDNKEVLKICVESILTKTNYNRYKILIIDNNSIEISTKKYLKILNNHEKVFVQRYPNEFNFSAINNFAVQNIDSQIIGLINNDVEVISTDWLREMVSLSVKANVGCVGAKLIYPNNTVQHAGIILGIGGVAGHSHKYFHRSDPGYFGRLCLRQSLSAVTAACMILRRKVFIDVGGFDENLKVAFNDVDFCLKVRKAGYRNIFTPFAELYHYESYSRGREDNPQKVARFNSEVDYIKTKWNNIFQNDPYYNPNLSLTRENFAIASKPRLNFV